MQRRRSNRIVGAIFKGAYYTIFSLTRVRISMSIRYLEFSRMIANFPSPVSKVQEVLPSQKLRPVQHIPGTTMVSLWAMEYRHIDYLDPYNEFAIGVPVLYVTDENNAGLPGYYVLHLPVTTEEARWGGVEIFGFPKFVAEISFEDEGEMCRSQVRAEGKEIIALEVKKLNTEHQSRDEYIYSIRDDRLLRTVLQVQGQAGTTDIQGGASYYLGDHPIADGLRTLEMDKTSAGHEYAPQLQTVLRPPKERLSLK